MGRFLDPSCAVAMFAHGGIRHGAVCVADEVIFLKLVNKNLEVIKRMPIDPEEVNQVGDGAISFNRVIDFDHDGRDEMVTEEALPVTGDPSITTSGRLFHVVAVRGRKLLGLWENNLFASWRAGEQCPLNKKAPCSLATIDLGVSDLDGDGVDELILHSKEATYRDVARTELVSRDERREVFWFDGTRFNAKRVGPPLHASSGKAAPTPLSNTPSGALARFQARLSEQDHLNARTGAPLKYAAQVIRQDRALYHSTKRADPEDGPDSRYSKVAARSELAKLLEEALSPTESKRIMEGTPLVDVIQWPDRAEVMILSE